MSTPLVIIKGGAYQGGQGEVTVVDLDNFDQETVAGRLEILHDLAEAIDFDKVQDGDLLDLLDKVKDKLLEAVE